MAYRMFVCGVLVSLFCVVACDTNNATTPSGDTLGVLDSTAGEDGAVAAGEDGAAAADSAASRLCTPNETDTVDCSAAIPHATVASQNRTCESTGEGYIWSSCEASSCEDGYELQNARCLLIGGTGVEDKTIYRELVVDFGSSLESSVFGATGMNNAFVGPESSFMTADTASGPAAATADATAYYQGANGGTISLVEGDVVVVTWVNNSGSTMTFYPLISFADTDYPVNAEGEPQWYIMKDGVDAVVSFLGNGQTVETLYVVTDAEAAPGSSPPSAGNINQINVSTKSARPGLICSKIELLRRQYNVPSAPQNLRRVASSVKPHFQVELAWDFSEALGLDTVYYKIFRDGLWVDKSDTLSFIDYNLEPNTTYHYTVTAVSEAKLGSVASNEVVITTAALETRDDLINPEEKLQYLGAFSFPQDHWGPSRWSYRKGGIAHYPTGDPDDVDGDGVFSGSLFAFGFAGTDNPDQDSGSCYVGEISIPQPVISKVYEELPVAQQIGAFRNVKPDNYPSAQLPASSGLVYLANKDKFYTSFGDDYNVAYQKRLSHGAFSPDFAAVDGLWMVGDSDDLSNPHTDSYIRWMMKIPQTWADTYTPGKTIISGGSRGGPTPMGVGMVAIQPWNDDGSTPAPDAEIKFTKLVHYDINTTGGTFKMAGFLNSDNWSGGAWLENSSGSTVLVAGTKMFGEYYYGFHDGTVYADVVNNVPTSHDSEGGSKGGRGRSFKTMLVFYDPVDLGRVASGELAPNQIQPYTALWLDDYMLVENTNDPTYEYRLGTVEFDAVSKTIYLVERRAAVYGYEPVDVIHVFRLLD